MRARNVAQSREVTKIVLKPHPARPAELGRLIRNHWSVESSCHHLLDVTYREDHCQARDKAAADSLTLMREISSKVLKTSSVRYQSNIL